MNEEQTILYIMLTLMPDLGSISRNRLIRLCGNIENCFFLQFEELLCRDANQTKKSRIGEKKMGSFIRSRNEAEYRIRAEEIY